MSKGNLENRPLAVLRAMLDAIDRDVLQLLGRRMAIVGEIAAYKREHGLKIRDLSREREVLRDRGERGERLGLPSGVVESIYRLLLLASRDYQAALRAEVPPETERKTVAIVGGNGGMGRTLAGLFVDLGHAVLIADLDTTLTKEEAAASSDVVIVSVPIRATETVIREIGKHVRPGSLLMDVTSIKEAPMRAMLESTQASVLGAHPMFGPGVRTLPGQRIVLCRGRGDAWFDWVNAMFRARGLVITESTPEEHDRVMAVVQVLNHFQTQALGLALSRFGVPLERSLAFTSPVYLLETYVTARHFAQSADLYGPIEMMNPQTAAVTKVFREAVDELAAILDAQDQAAFEGVFEEVRGFFGEFAGEALEQSRFLLDRLVELTAGRAGSSGRT